MHIFIIGFLFFYLQDGAVAPLYQQGRSYLQRSFIKGLVTTDFGGEFNYKWTEVAK
nr:hypothetical protein [Bacillus wiedmannii]